MSQMTGHLYAYVQLHDHAPDCQSARGGGKAVGTRRGAIESTPTGREERRKLLFEREEFDGGAFRRCPLPVGPDPWPQINPGKGTLCVCIPRFTTNCRMIDVLARAQMCSTFLM